MSADPPSRKRRRGAHRGGSGNHRRQTRDQFQSESWRRGEFKGRIGLRWKRARLRQDGEENARSSGTENGVAPGCAAGTRWASATHVGGQQVSFFEGLGECLPERVGTEMLTRRFLLCVFFFLCDLFWWRRVNELQRKMQKGSTPYLRGEADPTYLRKDSDKIIIGGFAVISGIAVLMVGRNLFRMMNGDKN